MRDINGSLDALARCEHDQGPGPQKLSEDLDRYEKIIEESRPELIIETGTRNGESARWFSLIGNCRVITIDVNPVEVAELRPAMVLAITGDSVSPRVIGRVTELARGLRTMVSLDSDHSAAHVAQEIGLYAPLVTPGCYLVIEDGIFHYADHELRSAHMPEMVGDPLIAIMGSVLPHSRRWQRNRLVEDMHEVTHHPAGWWLRVER
jgi:cephalosporin hydroxylase